MKTNTICDSCGNGPRFGDRCTSGPCSWAKDEALYKKNWIPIVPKPKKVEIVHVWIVKNVTTGKVVNFPPSRRHAQALKRHHEKYYGGKYQIIHRKVEV